MRKRLASIPIPPRFCAVNAKRASRKAAYSPTLAMSMVLSLLLIAAAHPTQAQSARKSSRKHSAAPAAKASTPTGKKVASAALGTPGENELAKVARPLRDRPSATAYAALAAFQAKNARNEFGARAALALGYYDITRDKPDLALGWLRKSVGEKLLAEYVLYWQAQTSLALGQKDQALEQLQSFRREYPDSVMTEQAVTQLTQTALAMNKNADALVALNAYANTAAKPALLLLRAQAEEKLAAGQSEKPVAATADYLDLYYRFPLNDEGKAAALRIPSLQSSLGEAFPGTPMQTQIARAETFFIAKRWPEARSEYAGLLSKLAGKDRERATLRIAQCDVQSGGRPEILAELSLTDPELDAERLFAISQVHRSQKVEQQMLDDIDQLVKRFPQSSWIEDALFAAGNYFWVNMDRDRAADFYRRALDASPNGKNSQTAAWRVAWIAYMERKPEAADLLEAYVRRFPMSPYVQDALYWLGRSYERSGNLEAARGFFLADVARFPLTYFGEQAAARLRPGPDGIGVSPATAAEFLAVIPAAPELRSFDQPLSAKAQERQARARVLNDIAFDASAELEYRAAYSDARAPQLLIAAAASAINAGHYAAGMVAMRQAIPQLEARRVAEIPTDVWRTAFPLPYESTVRVNASRNQLDPMLMAGLIRQESAFEANAMSRVGAMGLMQVMPATAHKLTRQLRIRYSRTRLTDPGYNLQLGARYLANLIQQLGTPEAALAAYNAGEDRVAQWTAGQNYLETAEFVESIPFTETREYVQIVIRNADVYRKIYGRGSDITNAARTAMVLPAKPEASRTEKEEKQ
jgi:soluble lytic murein transglycosylase